MSFLLGLVIGLLLGGSCGAVLGAVLSANRRADDWADSMVVPAADIAERLSDRLVQDFHVYRDDRGNEYIVATKPSPRHAAEDSPPSG